MDPAVYKQNVKDGQIYRCPCGSPVKPRIVFFGESLPNDFFTKMRLVQTCDLLIVMGTALAVDPFA